MLEIKEIKKFLRIEYDEDDKQLYMLRNAAERYMIGAVGNGVDMEDERVKTIMLMYIADMYEKRTMQQGNGGYSAAISTMIQQIQLEMGD